MRYNDAMQDYYNPKGVVLSSYFLKKEKNERCVRFVGVCDALGRVLRMEEKARGDEGL